MRTKFKILVNIKSNILLFFCGLILFTSCNKNFSVQKRKYNKGFYFASNKGNKNNAPKVAEIKNQENVEETPDKVYASVSNAFTFEKEPNRTKTKKSTVVAPPTKKNENIKLKDVFYKPMNIKTYGEKLKLRSNTKNTNAPGVAGGGASDFMIYLVVFLIAFVVFTVIAYSYWLDPVIAIAVGLGLALLLIALVAMVEGIISAVKNPPSFSECFNNCFINVIAAAIAGIIGSIFGCS